MSFKSILNRFVEKTALLIWPDEEGHETSDVLLLLSLKQIKGDISTKVILGTASDGETPCIKNENEVKISGKYNIQELPEREKEWRKNEFWFDDKSILGYEFFDNTNEFSKMGIAKQTITCAYYLKYFRDNEQLGIRIVTTGGSVYSYSYEYGNMVSIIPPKNLLPFYEDLVR